MTIRVSVRELLARMPIVDAAFRRFIWSRLYFPENEMRFIHDLPRGALDVAVDVGAAQGSYAWILNRKAREVHAFEPGEKHGRYLRNASVFSRVKTHACAVGAAPGIVEMFTPGDDSNALHSATLSATNPVVHGVAVEVRNVEQVTLDEFFGRGQFTGRTIDILKVDVEGYELEVFKGANRVLAKHRPIVICEIEIRHNADYRDVFSLLRRAGYRSLAYINGAFRPVDVEQVALLQTEQALQVRIGRAYNPVENKYINNFVFEHEQSRIKVMQ